MVTDAILIACACLASFVVGTVVGAYRMRQHAQRALTDYVRVVHANARGVATLFNRWQESEGSTVRLDVPPLDIDRAAVDKLLFDLTRSMEGR